MREAALRPGHPTLAEFYNNLASNLDAQRRYAEAEPLFRKALTIREATLRAGHPHIAMGYNNLASNLKDQRRYADADPLFRKALTIWEATLPANHLRIAIGYNNLGSNLEAQRRYADAEPVLRKALAIGASFSRSNPDRINFFWSMATNLRTQRKSPVEVRSYYREAGAGTIQRIGSFTDFGPAAQAEIRRSRPIFTGQVRAVWDLAAGAH